MSEELALIESTDNLMILKQLPVIEQNLITLKPKIEAAVSEALALEVTEDTVKNVKKTRAELNNMGKALDSQRMNLKNALAAPYDAFMQVYADCVTRPLRQADQTLRDRVNDVEQTLKDKKAESVVAYFNEYALSKNLEWLTFEDSGIKVGLSDTETALKKKAAQFIDDKENDIDTIHMQEHADEIMVEYKVNGLSLARAIQSVNLRHDALERERERQDAAAKAREQQAQAAQKVEQVIAASAPIVQEVAPQEEKLTTTFTITDTRERLRALKEFLEKGGYEYKNE
jgi:hypothetical protein